MIKWFLLVGNWFFVLFVWLSVGSSSTVNLVFLQWLLHGSFNFGPRSRTFGKLWCDLRGSEWNKVCQYCIFTFQHPLLVCICICRNTVPECVIHFLISIADRHGLHAENIQHRWWWCWWWCIIWWWWWYVYLTSLHIKKKYWALIQKCSHAEEVHSGAGSHNLPKY